LIGEKHYSFVMATSMEVDQASSKSGSKWLKGLVRNAFRTITYSMFL
jgi:hypothetical protein